MTDNIDESTTTATTFVFASGQILVLNEDQIEKIPYLTAVVSSADRFESARDENGYYKLDRHIEFQYFSFLLQSLSFHSVRQLFTCLPKQNDIIPIIALWDFVGLGPQPDPTLNEVDSVFFSTVVYSPLLDKYLQIVRPSVIQDMAVRFAVAMAKEEYDFTKREVVDKIYWFIMFILCAHKLFGPRLRYHVYKIVEHCFSLFQPSLLKPLKKLVHRAEKDTRRLILTRSNEDIDPDEENKCPFEQLLDLDYYYPLGYLFFNWDQNTLEERQELLLYRRYRKYNWLVYRKPPTEEDLLEPVFRRVLEIMYERLQSEICQCARIEIWRRKNLYKVAPKRTNLQLFLYLLDYETLPKGINDILKSEPVQEEIRDRILEEICILTPQLEEQRVALVKDIQVYEQSRELFSESGPYFYVPSFGLSYFETMQEKALSFELALNKLHQGSSLAEQIHRRVYNALYEIALTHFNRWVGRQRYIDELYRQLTPCDPSDEVPSNTTKTMHQHQRFPRNKPFPKHQLKHSTR